MIDRSAFRATPPRSNVQRGAFSFRCLAMDVDADDREARAKELESMGRPGRASYQMYTCKDALCPSCAKDRARRNAARALVAIHRFRTPHFVTITLPSAGPFDLGGTLERFRQSLTIWRRRTGVATRILGGIGSVEPRLDRAQALWAVHAHLVVDSTSAALDLGSLREVWDDVTDGRGRLLEPRGGTPLRSPRDAAKYSTKGLDWSPPAGELPLRALEALMLSIRRKRQLICWGTARESKPSESRPTRTGPACRA
jgi:hypothetical protein